MPKQDVVLFRKVRKTSHHRHHDSLTVSRKQGDYIFSHFYNMGIGLTKLAVLALYYRIFMTPKFNIVTKTTAVVVALWIVALEITLGFACRPIAAWWGAAEGDCLSKAGFTLFTNVSNLVFDLWIFLMPIRTILGLQGMRDRKLSLCLLFSVGLGTCAISAARLVWVFKVGVRDFTCTSPNPFCVTLLTSCYREARSSSHLVCMGALRRNSLRQPPRHLRPAAQGSQERRRHAWTWSQVQEQRPQSVLSLRLTVRRPTQPQLGAAQRQRCCHSLQGLGGQTDGDERLERSGGQYHGAERGRHEQSVRAVVRKHHSLERSERGRVEGVFFVLNSGILPVNVSVCPR